MADDDRHPDLINALAQAYAASGGWRNRLEGDGVWPRLPPLPDNRPSARPYERPGPPRWEREVAETISPTMGAYGLASLGTTAAMDAGHGKYDPETLTPLIAMAAMGAKRNPLAMDEASRMARARQMGFDPETRYYHGTASDFDAFDRSKFGASTGADSARQAAWLVDDPRTAAGYARYAAEDAPIRRLMQDAETYERLAQKTGQEKWWDKQNDAVIRAETLEKELRDSGAPGQRVIPAHTRGRFAEHDMGGAEFTDVSKEIQRLLREAQAAGYQGAKFHNLADDTGLNGRPATHVAVFDPKNIRSPWAEFDPAKTDSAKLLAGLSGAAILPGIVLDRGE